jgi:hypothetical protein
MERHLHAWHDGDNEKTNTPFVHVWTGVPGAIVTLVSPTHNMPAWKNHAEAGLWMLKAGAGFQVHCCIVPLKERVARAEYRPGLFFACRPANQILGFRLEQFRQLPISSSVSLGVAKGHFPDITLCSARGRNVPDSGRGF